MTIYPTNQVLIWSLLFVGLGLCCAVSCQSLPRSGFDPKGERLFESCPLEGILPSNCDLLGRRKQPKQPQVSTTPLTATPIPTPVDPGATVFPNTTPVASSNQLPGQFGAAQPGTASGIAGIQQFSSTATSINPAIRGINTAIIASPDVIPKPVFEETGGYALPTVPIEGPAILMTPREQIAPIGSEVVLISSYLGSKDRLITNEKIEWTLEGVGTIQKFDGGSICDPLHFDYVRAKKITDHYAITKTSQLYQTLDRGTPETKDDLHLLKGQTWVSVNSMREGTTYVTAFAPSLKDWSKRSDAGIIHWVDAQWVLPRLSIAPVGDSRILTTTVLRRTNAQPRNGWLVRYEILNGPPAGLGQSSVQIEEKTTDVFGQASVILSPRGNHTGTNTISIQIIRPAGVDGSDRRITVGSETIRQTWSGNTGVRITLTGPGQEKVIKRGDDIPYIITLTNTTSHLGKGVVVFEVPALASFTGSQPTPTRTEGASLLWNVEIQPKATATIQCTLRADTIGSIYPVATFYPQGISPETRSPITGTSVPLSSVDPSTVPPTLPNSSNFPATGVPTTRVPTTGTAGTGLSRNTQPSSGSGATVFQRETQSGVNLKIEPYENKIELGKPLDFYFIVENHSLSEIKNVQLRIEIPPECRNYVKDGAAFPSEDGKAWISPQQDYVYIDIPSIPATKNAYLRTKFPNLPPQGYRIVGTLFVNNQKFDQIIQQIKPK
ncbi:MAG: hypothetical protein LBE12_07225 [Planctomycetaceae bacterium]|jgi:hypothetical protein|nr:hypothetical protein [Planctomycetaceae bacterium]